MESDSGLDYVYELALRDTGLTDKQVKDFVTQDHTQDIPKAIRVFESYSLRITENTLALLEEYKVTKQDLDNLYKIVFLANMMGGPLVLRDPKRGGYGLFADKDYAPLEGITYYGGEEEKDGSFQGDYAIYNPTQNITINGEYGFMLHQKGRWINEFAKDEKLRTEHQNVTTKIYDYENQIVFGAKKEILRGEQIFWDYGEQYDRRKYTTTPPDVWGLINQWDKESNERTKAIGGAGFGQPTQQSLSSVLEEVGIPRNSVFIDLGSGTGTVLFHASSNSLAQFFHGIEFSPQMVKQSHWRQVELEKAELIGNNIHIREGDILNLTQGNLNKWSKQNTLPLVLFSFDAVMPKKVIDKIRDLARDYQGPQLIWITTFSSYRLGLETKKLASRLLIGPAGVTEQDDHLVEMSDQSANYPEEEWKRMEQEQEQQQKENMKRFVASDYTLPQMESFEIHVYRKKGNIMCNVCNSRVAEYRCGNCGENICGLEKCKNKN